MPHQPNLCDADYHWSSAAKRNFLEELSMTGSVSEACRVVGKSRRAAYNLRTRKGGRGFRIGWDAAMLVHSLRSPGRECLVSRETYGVGLTLCST